MPVLLWVAFWSLMMGSAAACMGDAPQAVPVKVRDRRD
jgi:hypothetical protein